VIVAEGTGSFNTNVNNIAADGMPGIQTDLSIDLKLATNLLVGKILGYAYYGEQFNTFVTEAVRNGVSFGGNQTVPNLFNFMNWQTPIVDLKENTIRFGVYATDQNWINNVWDIYRRLINGTSDDIQAYSNYILSIDKGKVLSLGNGILPEVEFYIDPFVATNHGGVPNGQNIVNTKRI
jgi:hypothetical protein